MTGFEDVKNDAGRFTGRIVFMALLVLAGMLVLASRAYYLQVLHHEEFQERAESNRTAVVPIVPYRGNIVDRNGVLLAGNYSAYTLEISPARVRNLEQTINELAELVDIQPIHRRRFERLRSEAGRYDSLPIRTQLSDEEVARFAAQSWRFPGVQVAARLFRTYPMGNTASHVIGYIGRITQQNLERIEERDEEANYRGSTHIGKLGIEDSYESELHGITGVEQLERSSAGRPLRVMDSSPARAGNTVVLSLDIKLQRLVEELFGERRGALVAIDPSNGEILAMVSMPTFNPNLFVEGIDQENWQALNESIDRPLFNRALRGTYPPGSTYKPFMALAALETGARSANTVIQDGGTWTLAGHRYRSGAALGPVDMRRSITRSSNVYYYSLAYEMGVEKIHDFMKPLGFGQLTGIDLNGESRGILPNREWKRNAFSDPRRKSWIPGDTVSLGIGQGYNSFTMLQLAHATATLANAGISHRPHLAKGRLDVTRNELLAIEQPAGVDLGYRPEHLRVIAEGMEGVVLRGTSRRVFAGAPYRSAGKTGTAQAASVGQRERYNAAKLAEHQRDHSLYIAFAPLEKPQIAVAVIVENAGFGAAHAAPIARRVMDYWLAGLYPSAEDIAAVQTGRATAAPLGQPRRVDEVAMDAAVLPLHTLKRSGAQHSLEPWQHGPPAP
ncbi:penicillin-binding protein 2 [Vandammella animalimorsus]|uniref:Peptidoglycan D,D-transpeptidase MrdA n=1 Tax=Vandammella animalimorsus TaxID=2029117 RepID=A0A2A2T7S1_9BURK|nr:penicillin-binding protein 2 [Vandammella animalimorsus]PAT31814.1 penicillin-binding protein 2 [Vandammella animalimorsus]PAX17946.1 penicillin-binding protein 2 [Vandammella animalimorsus]PAX20100.1 penicillin-binding protein 2 [Vandammella animalimorsus]